MNALMREATRFVFELFLAALLIGMNTQTAIMLWQGINESFGMEWL